MAKNSFDELVTLYRAINFRPESREGRLVISDDEQKALAARLLSPEATDDFGLQLIRGNVNTLEVGYELELKANDPKLSLGLVAVDLNELLLAPKARIREPARYFILGEKFSKADDAVPSGVQRYRKLLTLIALFKDAAAYLDDEACELVFIDGGKFQLPVVYDTEDLKKADSDSLDRLLESFTIDTHRDQKLAILSRSVQLIASAAKARERFKVLLEHLPELQKSFSEGYRLFVADFSYEKVVDQLEVAKLEEIGKIHKTFSDVQNQILGIPVATIIVASQMKSATTVGQEFWVNTAVLIGCWIFAALTVFILRNQLQTLTSIGDEIARKKQQMLENYKPVADLITNSFPLLENRLNTQRIAFYAVDIILVIGLVLAHVVYFYLTTPARTWLTNCWGPIQDMVHGAEGTLSLAIHLSS